ncbi:MAG TPA: baseplate J protein [Lactobacillus acetotolerans]|nr:baseplate J protein [Lactobacillus acetotolerans]
MDELLNKLIPIPDEDELESEIKDELNVEGFKITNFRTGGVFRTIIRIFIKIYVELLKLSRTILKNSTVGSSEGAWVDLRAADYSKIRKAAQRTKGQLTLSRTAAGTQITIPKGYIFKTEPDSSGRELRYVNLETKIMLGNETSVNIILEAESPGAEYNVPSGQIVKSLIHIEGIETITNTEDWIISEGSDEETDESLKQRTKNSWAELSGTPIRDRYKNVAESIPGVLVAEVDDQHPRGQGTVDISIISPTGTASQSLIDKVTEACEAIKGPYDNLLVKSAEAIITDITVNLIIPYAASDEGLIEQATSSISNLFISKRLNTPNELYISELIYVLKKDITILKNVQVLSPAADMVLLKGQIVTLGTVTVTIERA